MNPGSPTPPADIPGSTNWYEPPSHLDPPPGPVQDETGLLKRWEKLRVPYNAILAIETVALLMARRGVVRINMDLPTYLAGCCFGANLCFCVGPIANAYAHWIGLRHRAVTIALFLAGMGFAMLLAAVAILLPGLAGID